MFNQPAGSNKLSHKIRVGLGSECLIAVQVFDCTVGQINLHYVTCLYMIYRLFTVMVSLALGLNLLTFGAFSERVLQITHNRTRYNGFWERFVFRKGVVDRFGLIGLLGVSSGIALNYKTIVQYVTTLQVTIHWSYVLTGATLLLCGFQMVMASFLIEILKAIAAQKTQFRRTDGSN